MNKPRIYTIKFASVYPAYLKKVERKNRTKEEVDEIIFWLTGYNQETLRKAIEEQVDLETFFACAPKLNENAALIKGVVCGIRVEEIEDTITQKVRYMDKLIDELAKGKTMDKILRKK